MTRGRKPGIKVGPTMGSRPWMLLRMKPAARLLLPTYAGNGSRLMQQVSSDIQRNGLNGKRVLSLGHLIIPSARELLDVVVVSCTEDSNHGAKGGSMDRG